MEYVQPSAKNYTVDHSSLPPHLSISLSLSLSHTHTHTHTHILTPRHTEIPKAIYAEI